MLAKGRHPLPRINICCTVTLWLFKPRRVPVSGPGSGFTPFHLLNNGTIAQSQVKQLYLGVPCF